MGCPFFIIELTTMQEFDNISNARLMIAEMIAADQYPVIVDHEIEDVIRQCRLKDKNGYPVGDANYCLTIDVNLVCTRLWARKAGRAAGDFDFKSDNQQFTRSQIIEHCLQMQRHYQKQVMGVWPAPHTDTKERFRMPQLWRD